MKPSTLDAWVWVLLYGGLLAMCLAVFVARGDAAFGWTLGAFGAAAVALGVLLIYLRSRMKP
jgi:hypothetical protein